MYYYARNGQQFGPHSEEELRGLVANGQVGPNDPVWKQGMQDWAPLRTVIDLGPVAVPPPPPPAPTYAPPAPPAYSAPQAMATAAVHPDAKSRATYVLFGVFLGGLGIHNFYAGYTGRAIAQLLITVLTFWLIVPLIAVGIWVIIEMVTVTKDAKGIPFI